MTCNPASPRMSSIFSQMDSQMEEGSVQRRGSKAYQIFPEANINEDTDYQEDFLYRRERLPSIVVEPIEYSDQESGEGCWPRQCLITNKVGKAQEGAEDSCVDHMEGSGDEEHQEGMQESLVSQKSSMGPSQSQLSVFRLTPPASPTTPEAFPPCLRS
ncbi:unnamed protein product [Menidia menidia]|uniref:(Atlantic silverside) hypothetical protein n=1 Tax=Menidia menidia TaxID=238744 RepID=A0A8S4AUA9_9TELE|nr:unnamed protein product [Menidia menidia]